MKCVKKEFAKWLRNDGATDKEIIIFLLNIATIIESNKICKKMDDIKNTFTLTFPDCTNEETKAKILAVIRAKIESEEKDRFDIILE